jgi:hypothetical protein
MTNRLNARQRGMELVEITPIIAGVDPLADRWFMLAIWTSSSGGWSVQAGPLDGKWMGSAGANADSFALGVQSSPGVSVTYGLSMSQIKSGLSYLTGN